MARANLRSFARLLSPRHLALGLCTAGLPWLGLGELPPAVLAAEPPVLPAPRPGAVPAGAPVAAETLPPSVPLAQAPAASKVLPISLDTVFRLAEEQNVQIQLAHEKVNGACAQLDVAALNWLPRLYVGPAYYRHEGGIQDETGVLVHSSSGALFAGLEANAVLDLRDYAFQKVKAERDVWQQKGDLSRITNETLQEASYLYIDLLRARSEEALARTQVAKQAELLKLVQSLGKGYQAEVDTVEADLQAYSQLAVRMRQLQQAASARLVYLLGLDPCTELVPVDNQLQPFDLIDASAPTCELVSRALAAGPGIRETEGMLNLILSSIEKAKGPSRFLPVIEMRMAEGGFAAGPGDSMTGDNRWDLGLQARWDLSSLLTAKQRQRVAESKLTQAHLSLQDLRGKLTAGVQESREAILSTREQLMLALKRIKYTEDAYLRRHDQWTQGGEEKRTIIRELIQNIRSLREANHDYLETIDGYDKAELRLILLLGPSAPPPAQAAHCP